MENKEKSTKKKMRTQVIFKEEFATVLRQKVKDTAMVEVVKMVKHPFYGRRIKRKVKYLAHLPENMKVHKGDVVVIRETTKPISKMKHWIIKHKK
jgi:small subunit ribosomal protein S17